MIPLILMAIGGCAIGWVFGFKSGAETAIRWFQKNLPEGKLRELTDTKRKNKALDK
jgi:hypothetical protein